MNTMLLYFIVSIVLFLLFCLLYYVNTESFKRAHYFANYEAIQELEEVHFQKNQELEEAHRDHINELKQKSHTG